MTDMKVPLRLGILAGASALALGLAAPVSAQTNTAPLNRSGDMNKIGETQNQQPVQPGTGAAGYVTTPGTAGNTPPKNAGDANKLGEVGQTGTPVGAGTQIPTGGSYRASGAATTPGVPPNDGTRQGTMGVDRGSAGMTSDKAHQRGMSGQRHMNGTAGATNLEVTSVNLRDLPPNLQQAIRGRMGPQQRPNELIETTILNRLALMNAEYQLSSARQVGNDYVLVVVTPDGQESTMVYELAADRLREVQL